MTRFELVNKILQRKKDIKITNQNISTLSGLSVRTINRLLNGEDVKISTIEKITNLFGLDFSGKETISLKELNKNRAHKKALFLASLVQSTSALEMQGLEKDKLNTIILDYEKQFLYGEYANTLWVD